MCNLLWDNTSFTWPFQDKITILNEPARLRVFKGTNFSSGDEIRALNQIIKLVYNIAFKTRLHFCLSLHMYWLGLARPWWKVVHQSVLSLSTLPSITSQNQHLRPHTSRPIVKCTSEFIASSRPRDLKLTAKGQIVKRQTRKHWLDVVMQCRELNLRSINVADFWTDHLTSDSGDPEWNGWSLDKQSDTWHYDNEITDWIEVVPR